MNELGQAAIAFIICFILFLLFRNGKWENEDDKEWYDESTPMEWYVGNSQKTDEERMEEAERDYWRIH